MNAAEFVWQLCRQRLAAYKLAPHDVREHYGIEEAILAGGYGYRQLLELVQNGADAILEEFESAGDIPPSPGRLEVILGKKYLYVANSGAPLSIEGIEALLSSHSSPKRGIQIGRFGIGFKSLLRLRGRIDVFGHDLSIRFDPERCRNSIRKELGLGLDAPAPALRLAWVIDRSPEEAVDEKLRELNWATTIVRAEIGDEHMAARLAEEIRQFPAPFLLFLPVDIQIELDDGTLNKRCLYRKRNGSIFDLFDGVDLRKWFVTTKSVTINEAAAWDDATHLHARSEIPLAWALPYDGAREEAGRFWAFFPTETPTRLAGILNAPWKLNSDRKAIIGGSWNDALIAAAAEIIASALPQLASNDDPGRPLDAFPRDIERRDESAASLVEAVWNSMANAKVLADGTGVLREPSELGRHPIDNADLVAEWLLLAPEFAKCRVVHDSCLKGRRLNRLDALADRLAQKEPLLELSPEKASLRREEATIWFSNIASTDIAKAKRVFAFIRKYSDEQQRLAWEGVRPKLAVIPTAEGMLANPMNAVIAPPGTQPPGTSAVDPELASDSAAKDLLVSVLGVKALDTSEWHRFLMGATNKATRVIYDNTIPGPEVDKAWGEVWEILRACPAEVRSNFGIELTSSIRIRCKDGWWVVPHETLLPGDLIPPNDLSAVNQRYLVDQTWHAKDGYLLEVLGVKSEPRADWADLTSGIRMLSRGWSIFNRWRSEMRDQYMRDLTGTGRPRRDLLGPKDMPTVPAACVFLDKFEGAARSRLTRLALERVARKYELNAVQFIHTTSSRYPAFPMVHPALWAIREYGMIEIGGAELPIKGLLPYRDEPICALIGFWKEISQVLERIQNYSDPSDRSALSGSIFWKTIFNLVCTSSYEDIASFLPRLWRQAAQDLQIPEQVPTINGNKPLFSIYVTESADLAALALEKGLATVSLDSDTASMWIKHGAKRLDQLLTIVKNEKSGHLMELSTAFPDLAPFLSEETKAKELALSCDGLGLELDGTHFSEPCVLWNGHLLFDQAQLIRLSRRDRFARILRELQVAGWLTKDAQIVLDEIADIECDARRRHVADGETLAHRLWRAVGERPEPLIAALGSVFMRAVSTDPDGVALSDLALAMHGPAVLSLLQNALDSEGLKPPPRWGTSESKTFAVSLGFPEAFGGSTTARREPELWVSGPILLPKLHDYQEEVISGLTTLVNSKDVRRRAIVSLPTGAGKTRVVVEASVKLVLASGQTARTVLWVADTDELCEQAVQAFRQVWINIGREGTDLRIIRLWGSNPNPVKSADDGPVVVVASIQTLTSRTGSAAISWLSRPSMVVLDECHHAITPSYTGLLQWMDAAGRPVESEKPEPTVIGLSATPFRGFNEEESRRLASRFDRRWLPSAQEQLHQTLRDRRILSQIDDEALESKAELTAEEAQHVERFGELPAAFNERLGHLEDRNRLIVNTITKSGHKSVLLFANTVEHAEELAARLHWHGITAAAVSGKTPSATRRYFLDRFQRGDIRVLCNHSVLTTGFDAPRTDMILIARQVLSPVRYMQMVGRGLRGPVNGGTERCRIVTVVDNLGRFSGKHPYHFCAHYFRSDA